LAPSEYDDLDDDLYLTGCHSILIDEENFTKEQEFKSRNENSCQRVYKTDDKIRLMAQFDERAIPYQTEGEYEVWHVALEHENPEMNYGIYANGLLVESCCQYNMGKRGMKLV